MFGTIDAIRNFGKYWMCFYLRCDRRTGMSAGGWKCPEMDSVYGGTIARKKSGVKDSLDFIRSL